MKVSLTKKILLGNLLLLVVIVGMAAIMLHERGRMREIDSETQALQAVRARINVLQLNVTELAILGENVISWEEADFTDYRRKRLATDSLLLASKSRCGDYVRPGQIDTLRQLLADKETHLHGIMEAIWREETADSLLVNHLPEVARRATRVRTVKQRKRNILGAFGGKKTVQVMPSSKELHSFSDSLIALQQEGDAGIETNADSLCARNLLLNDRLNSLVKDLDRQIHAAFAQREQKIAGAQALSVRWFTAALSSAILLLVLSHMVVRREIRRNLAAKKKREALVRELQDGDERNKRLLQFRKGLMQAVTHELRTALTSISGHAELLLKDDNDNPTEREGHIRAIRSSADRMAGMTTELLEFFRLDDQKERLNIRPFRSDSVAALLEMEFAPLAETKGLRFVTENLATEVLAGDKERILRIGSNLLSNAIKFTREGNVTLRTCYKDGIFTLSVQDTGMGFPPEKRDKIFAPFGRLGNAATQDGFGLGLAIVANLVQLMQGHISVESEPGKGSRFTVSLPLPKAEEVQVEEKKKEQYRALAGCAVLAIDNDLVTLRLMHEMYLRNHVECDTCRSLAELTEKLREKDYDLLVTDLKMPEANGYEILELLRMSDLGSSQGLPVVAATAAGYMSEEELKESGFAGLLPKPFSVDELLETTLRCARPPRKRRPDFSSLLAFGDKHRILEQLITETEKDMAEIRKAAGKQDSRSLDEWIHHLRSSWMVMRAEHPLQKLQEALHKEPPSGEEIGKAVRAVLEQGEAILEMARKEAGKWER